MEVAANLKNIAFGNKKDYAAQNVKVAVVQIIMKYKEFSVASFY